MNDKKLIDNLNIQTAGPRGPALLQDIWWLAKLAHFAPVMHLRSSKSATSLIVRKPTLRTVRALPKRWVLAWLRRTCKRPSETIEPSDNLTLEKKNEQYRFQQKSVGGR